MAFGSESEESEGVASVIFSTISVTGNNEEDKTESKSSAYWKNKDSLVKNDKKKYNCMVKGCSACFSRPWRLKAHLSIHYGKKPFPCTEKDCNRAYTTVHHLRRHISISHESQNENKLSTKFKCEYSGCTAEFKTRDIARKHYKRTHIMRTCKECGQIFGKRSQLLAHQYVHTGKHPFKCTSCEKGFLKQSELRKHERVHSAHICPEKNCFLTFITWSEVRKHLITHPRNYVCILCRKSYLCRKKLKEHIRKHADPEHNAKKKTVLLKFHCHLCSASLVGKASLRRHISVIHEGKPGQGNAPDQPPKKRKPRKDKGILKKAMAPMLADIDVPFSVDKKLLQRKGDELTDDEELLQMVFQQVKNHMEASTRDSNSEISDDNSDLLPFDEELNHLL